jgi:peptidoglycan LD-endopeptidase LytH
MKRKLIYIFLGFSILLLLFIYMFPCKGVIPVKNATQSSWNSQSFWFYPWGKSVTHKGIDIFAKKNTPVLAARSGIVIGAGTSSRGGKFVLIIDSHFRIYYYAHLNSFETSRFSLVSIGEQIGTVGNTGNAIGKADHLHFTIASLLPNPFKMDDSPQGWKKMFYIDPNEVII